MKIEKSIKVTREKKYKGNENKYCKKKKIEVNNYTKARQNKQKHMKQGK